MLKFRLEVVEFEEIEPSVVTDEESAQFEHRKGTGGKIRVTPFFPLPYPMQPVPGSPRIIEFRRIEKPETFRLLSCVH